MENLPTGHLCLYKSGIMGTMCIPVFCANVSIEWKNIQWKYIYIFKVYYIILNLYKQVNITKAKIVAYVLNLVLFP